MTEDKKSGTAVKIILPLLILLLGVGGFVALNKMKKVPQRQKPPQLGVLVDVIELRAETQQIKVHTTGTVNAEQEISLVPEVSGKVVWLAPQFVSGGLFQSGNLLLKVEASDYQLAVEKARAEIARAEVALRTEQERALVAQQEWQRMELTDKGEPGPLVTREIQLLQEQANLAAANANLKQAQLNLQRTELSAPYNGRIRQEQVDLGQYLRAGTSIGTFAGTDRAEIQAPLPVGELAWLSIPAGTNSEAGSTAIIRIPDQAEPYWQGRVTRSLGEIDASSRMATVVVSIDDPYRLQNGEKKSALLNGQFVEVEFLGAQLEQIIRIPRDALRSGGQVWIADQDNRLSLRAVNILRREQQTLLIDRGLAAGDKLIMTTLSGAADGLLLRPILQEQTP